MAAPDIQEAATTTTNNSSSSSSGSGGFHALVDRDEVSQEVCRQLNEVFGSTPNHLGRVVQLCADLQQTKEQLQQRLQFATTEAPDKITRAVKAAERALGEGERLLQEAGVLQQEVRAHKAKVGDLLEQVGPGVRCVGELRRVEGYQAFLSTVEEWSQDIRSSLHIGTEGQALLGHSRLLEGAKAVQGTECQHLYDYLRATLIHWNKALIQRFVSEFEGVLKSIKWPLPGGGEYGGGGRGSSAGGSGHPPASPEALQRLCTLTQYLLQLTLPEPLAPGEDDHPPSPPVAPPALLSNFDPLIIPIQLLINPLQVRFLYHFTGSRATNSRSHPEWYFIQLLKWVAAHDTFLTHRIQPVLERCGRGDVSAKVEFTRGLVRLAAIKLTSDLPHLYYDEDLFSQTVQEALHFERELCGVHGYPQTQPSILCVLTDPQVFPRWVTLERKFALEVMDELVSSEGAWEIDDYSGGGGETARCGEQVILLLQGITDRYKRLPQPGHRLQFLELQLDLLDDFRVRLLQVMKGERHDPLTSHYPAILNTTHHLSSTLADWADLPFFIEMQYYRERFCQAEEATTPSSVSPQPPTSPSPTTHTLSDGPTGFTLTSDPPSLISHHQSPSHSSSSSSSPPPLSPSSVPPTSLTPPVTPVHLQTQPAPPSSAQLARVTGSVFDATCTLYTHIEGEMVHTLATYVFSEVRARSLPYRKDRWHRSPPASDTHHRKPLKVTEASPSVCPLLEVLARHLHTLRDALAIPLFHRLWMEVAETLNKYIFEELVLETRFTEVGAAQFKFDMMHGLFPIFGEFTQKPENYFRLIKESALLLTLPRATVVLLQDTITAHSGDASAAVVVAPHRALAEHGVTLLTPVEAAAVLNARIYDQE